ncbi:MAG: glycoside hydrolase family 97 catalytic domain-containing protein [Cytophagales bacterium]|nr:glycoside hydrolase family 97 catalytic domain-containing protein [Cytophagales bacterium]
MNNSTYIRLFTTILTFLTLYSCNNKNKTWNVQSPDGKIKTYINLTNGNITYCTMIGADTVIYPSKLGIMRSDGSFATELSFEGAVETNSINESYEMTTGKSKNNINKANEIALTFTNAKNKKMTLLLRAYNEGIAIKYQFPETDSTTYKINNERTTVKLNTSGTAWLQPYGYATPTIWAPAYEEFYNFGCPVGQPAPDSSGWSIPALFNTGKYWTLVTEGGVEENVYVSHLSQNADNGEYSFRGPMAADGEGTGDVYATATLPWSSPWRVVMISGNIGGIFESNLVHHVSAPNILGDVSWIKPGKASWSWWGAHDSSKDYKQLKSFVDLAKEMGWDYSLVDANWDMMTIPGSTIEDLANYAKSQNISLTMWYNSGGIHNTITERPRNIMSDDSLRKAEFKKLKAMGVKGVKVDFFQSDKQHVVKLYKDILKDAADNQILVVFHGCTVPRGWARTYPNLMSMEAVRGAEQYGWSNEYAHKAPLHNVVLAYTRNVVGSMDYTPLTMSNYDCCKHTTTNAHELALAVIYESGIQHLADRAAPYKALDNNIKQYLKVLPVTWDNSKYIEGSPASHIVVARQSGDSWYIAGINGDTLQSREVTVDISFVAGVENNKIMLFTDGKSSTEIAVTEINNVTDKKLTVKMLPSGGFSAWIRK